MIFADTGAFLALYLQRDRYHRQAGFIEAANRVADLYTSPSIDILFSTLEDEMDAVSLMKKFADKQIGFTDCVSFAIMRRQRILTAFTFDRHFRHAGFRVIGLR